jgi:hypothetical protein
MKADIVSADLPGAMFFAKGILLKKGSEPQLFLTLYHTSDGKSGVFDQFRVMKKLGEVEIPDKVVDAAYAYLKARNTFEVTCEPFLWKKNGEGLFPD